MNTSLMKECKICGSDNSTRDEKITFYQNLADPHEIRRCLRCNFLWLSPQPSLSEYKELYGTGYLGAQRHKLSRDSLLSVYPPVENENYEEEVIPNRNRYFISRLRRLRKILPEARHLFDIGAGTGDFLALAKAEGWRVEGLEVSRYACERAFNKHGLSLICSDIDEFISHSTVQYDVIHLSHVFEHLLEPRDFLRSVKKIIKPGGVIIIEVPNQFRSLVDWLLNFKNRKSQIERSTFSIHHPYYYGMAHLSNLLRSEGYQILSCTTFLPERSSGGIKDSVIGFVDFCGHLLGGYGRNIEAIAKI